jgi:hypothetical protein
MNTRTFLSAVVLSVSSTIAFATANESSIAVVSGENSDIFKVIYKAASANRVQVSILDAKNEVVFTESFNKINGFTRPYNFNGLPEGEYTIEVEDNQGKKVEKVDYHLGNVKSLIKITKLSNELSKFMVSVPNQGKNKINVLILNEEGDVLLEETRKVVGDFGIVYNLVKTGLYTFVVSDKSGNVRMVQY